MYVILIAQYVLSLRYRTPTLNINRNIINFNFLNIMFLFKPDIYRPPHSIKTCAIYVTKISQA